VVENVVNGQTNFSQGFSAPSSTKNISAITITSNGIINVTMNANAKSVQFSLAPLDSSNGNTPLSAPNIPANVIIWACKVSATSNDRYVPAECRI
jgi:hypothetical protein